MKRSRAIFYVAFLSVTWAGTIPWMFYLALKGVVPYKVAIICAPFYAFLYYGAIKAFWPSIRDKK